MRHRNRGVDFGSLIEAQDLGFRAMCEKPGKFKWGVAGPFIMAYLITADCLDSLGLDQNALGQAEYG